VAVWKPNGEPCPITKIVDGSGILVEYYENGKKKLEAQFKNGKPISQKVF
jgi:antitoxin component YwqK of YwqJK toxin-antitoxin module